jgi:hypothetical protein
LVAYVIAEVDDGSVAEIEIEVLGVFVTGSAPWWVEENDVLFECFIDSEIIAAKDMVIGVFVGFEIVYQNGTSDMF